MRRHLTKLHPSPDFRKLWAGQTVSQFGSEITVLALPLMAVLTLQATPSQMGLLGTFQSAPYLLVGLFAGVWVDRRTKRPLLVATDLGRMMLLLSVPLFATLGLMSMRVLYAGAFLLGALTVVFEMAYTSYLPVLVPREQLAECNSKLEAGRTVAQIAGPSLASLLVQLVTAPFALVLDSASFLVSAIFLRRIKAPEPPPLPREERRGVWVEIREGLHATLTNPLLRPLVSYGVTSNFFVFAHMAVVVLYLTRERAVTPLMLGVIYTFSSVGGLLGSVVAGRFTRRLGLGPALVCAQIMCGVGALLVPLAGGPPLVLASVLVAAQALWGCVLVIYNVNVVSLRQAITPDGLQGRVIASIRFLTWGVGPLGSLSGGLLGEVLGLRPTLAVAGLGMLLASQWVLFSPVRGLRELPRQPA